PFEDLTQEEQDWVLYGEQGKGGSEEKSWGDDAWYGVQGFFDWLELKLYKMHVRVFLSRFRSYTTCRACGGGRLQPEAMAYKYEGRTLPELWQMPIEELAVFFEERPPNQSDPSAELLYEQVTSRLRYLDHVGLHYLTLDRSTRTLSGGEVQRVTLTTCLGASLVNTLFVLDEPSIGLHPRDIGRLIDVMRRLCDKGNTLVVVEHEEAIIRIADHLVDIGPGRGLEGGDLVYAGPMKADGPKRSLTFDYLTGRKTIPVPVKRRRVKKNASIVIKGARQHNLRKLDVTIPLGVFCAITGVSGSGKSTLMHHVLYRNLQKERGERSDEEPGRLKSLRVNGQLDEVVMVDQSPLSRTPRSTPAVYIGVFDLVRKLFAATPEAKAKSLTMGYFSFNSGSGRCERCWGSGYEKVEMQFLSDLFVKCPECDGRRYQPDALTVTLGEHSIADVLEMTVDTAAAFFGTIEGKMAANIVTSLQTLIEVGLGYLPMGRPLNTLSGGEAQRLKLVGHLLSKESRGKHALLIFDEPTTGLHFDDVARLLQVLQRLVDAGHSVLVIEHQIEVIKCADHVIELGPEAGAHGGLLVAEGTPEELAKVADSHTGRFLAQEFGLTDKVAEDALAYKALPRAAANQDRIRIHGARENNLKNIDLEIPRDQLVVVTGLSGSGKSTLAFDILFSEGQRRFLDSMSPYARQFTQQMEKAEVDLIEGLPPTVAIEQRISRGGGKSTVATVTEIYHFIRLLFSKVGVQHCPDCDVAVEKQSVSAIAMTVVKAAKKGTTRLLAPMIKARKGFHTEVADWAGNHGYDTLLVDGEFKAVEGFQKLARFKEHNIDV
ncbi:MAG: excinuclease ABC subunit UvrA, partial [Verrucomicrobiales bacterium]